MTLLADGNAGCRCDVSSSSWLVTCCRLFGLPCHPAVQRRTKVRPGLYAHDVL